MKLTVGILKDITMDEKRVAVVPEGVRKLVSSGLEVMVEHGAGLGAYFPNTEYAEAGAVITESRRELLSKSDIILTVQRPEITDMGLIKEGAVVVGTILPDRYPEDYAMLLRHGIRTFALEKIPRISRAQAMDILTSQSTCAGYSAALIAAYESPRFLPMLNTASGTVRPSRVLVIGAGVAGLMAIAMAKRLGASVTGYDVRKSAGADVKSLGAKFLDLGMDASTEEGYARELTEDEKLAQADALNSEIISSDIVIATASVPGRDAPLIISAKCVEEMKPGSVIVDLAADSGGNCELTRPGHIILAGNVKIVGLLNFPSKIPMHSSEMFSRNLVEFLMLLVREGLTGQMPDDEILRDSLLQPGELKIREAIV